MMVTRYHSFISFIKKKKPLAGQNEVVGAKGVQKTY